MSFGLYDKDWVDPDQKPEIKYEDCEYWIPCPCGCRWGWCTEANDYTDDKDGC